MKWLASAALLALAGCSPARTPATTSGEPLVQIWLPTGVTLHRSPSLNGVDLPRDLAADTSPSRDWIVLPDGRTARVFGMRWLAPTPLGTQALEVVVARETSIHDETLAGLAGLLFAAWGVASVGLAAVLFFVVRRGLAPLDRLGADIHELDARNLSADIDSPGAPAELRPVVDQLNAMIDRLRVAFEQEHAFSSHAAHELRTPLAGLRSTLELMLTRPRSVEEHARAADRCLGMTLELQGIVESLLELARPVDGHASHRETTDMTALLGRAWATRAELAGSRRITFSVAPQAPVELESDPRLLESLLENLVDNAVEYSPDGASIRCFVQVRRGSISCLVTNPAPGLTREDAHRTLEAFWRADASRQDTGRHAGLGLALARKIAERLGGKLQVRAGSGAFLARVLLPSNPR